MTRRAFVTASAALTVTRAGPVLAQVARRTPGQILGPYYPVIKPSEIDADLTRIGGRMRQATGQVIRVSGWILNEAGKPLSNAQIEIWQADARGHYTHPSDKTSGDADPDFQGYASLRSDADGRYGFVTIKPGAYPYDGAGGMRAPHIHFQVTGRINQLATQMYFPGEALNETDRVLAYANAGRDRLILRPHSTAGADGVPAGNWNIVLRDG